MVFAKEFWFNLAVCSVLMVWGGTSLSAQEKKKDAAGEKKGAPIAPAEKVADGWEEIDERLIFLMVRLANTESSLEAIEKVVAENTRKQNVKLGDARRAVRENEKMDQKGGGPMKWNQFYGTTAEKFFYHPTDRNSTYHTITILTPQPPQNDNQVRAGVPSRQGLPPHQRPPQFDYIYRANESAKARANEEAALLQNKVDALNDRRRKLELEQVALWIEIAFRAAAHFDLDKKPVFRFEPLVADNEAEAQWHADVLKSAASFMRVSLLIIDEATKDDAVTLVRIKPAVKQARQTFNDTWLRLNVDTSDKNTTEGKFAALAKRLDDVASNLTESYQVATEGDEEKDQQRKDLFRGQLQYSLVSYAQIVLAMDEMITEMKDKWSIKPNLDKPFGTLKLASFEAVKPLMRPKSPQSDEPGAKSLTSAIQPVSINQIANLEELNTPDLDIAPWVSADGLEIFWATGASDKGLRIWSARRSDLATPFGEKRQWLSGYAPVLNSDRLQILFRRADSEEICVASRNRPDEEFGQPQIVKSLSFPNLDAAPRWLTEDGLTLYLDMKATADQGRYHTWVTTRNTVDASWKRPVLVRANFPGKPKDFRFIQVSSTSEGLQLFCTAEFTPAGGQKVMRTGVLSRTKPDGPFTQWDEIPLPPINGQFPSGLRPVFVPALQQVFLTADAFYQDPSGQAKRRYDLWVIRNFQWPE